MDPPQRRAGLMTCRSRTPGRRRAPRTWDWRAGPAAAPAGWSSPPAGPPASPPPPLFSPRPLHHRLAWVLENGPHSLEITSAQYRTGIRRTNTTAKLEIRSLEIKYQALF